jgi:hypothetical protein
VLVKDLHGSQAIDAVDVHAAGRCSLRCCSDVELDDAPLESVTTLAALCSEYSTHLSTNSLSGRLQFAQLKECDRAFTFKI